MAVVDTDLLRYKMSQSGYKTHEDLADAIGVSRDTVSNLMRGRVYPSFRVMNGIYFALSLTPDEASDIFFNHNLRNAKVGK